MESPSTSSIHRRQINVHTSLCLANSGMLEKVYSGEEPLVVYQILAILVIFKFFFLFNRNGCGKTSDLCGDRLQFFRADLSSIRR